MIMTNWQTKKLGDIGRIAMCKRIMKDQTSAHGDIPFYKIGTFGKDPDAYIPSELYENYKSKYSFPKIGEILISASGTIGRAVVYDGSPAYFQDSNIVWLAHDESVVLNKFLGYAYTRVNWQTDSGTIARLYNDNFRRVTIKVPEKPEQERIVGVLEVWDEYIEKLEQKIALKEQLKKGLMQQLLTGKRRLSGYAGEWQSKKLGDLVEIKKGSGLSKDLITESGSKCVLYGEIYTKYDEIIDEVYSRTRSRNGVKSKSGDVLVPASTTTSNLDIATATSVHEDGVLLGGDINILRPKISVNSKFLSMLLSGPEKINLAKRAQGITIVHLYGKDFIKMKISLPSKEEQDAIVRVIETVRDEIKCLEPVLDNLKLQKKYLLKNLITGAIRTPEDLQPLDASRLERSAL